MGFPAHGLWIMLKRTVLPAKDAAGNATTRTTAVCVPKNQHGQ